MSAAEKISAARALIEPLTGHDDGPWDAEYDEWDGMVITTNERLNEHFTAIAKVSVDFDEPFETRQQSCARLIAAAPALRDTVAALTDLAEAQAQQIEAQALEISRAKSRGDNHWETLKGIRHIAKTSGDLERIILWVDDAGSGYMDRPEVGLAEVCDERNAARAEADAQAQEIARLKAALETARDYVADAADGFMILRGGRELCRDQAKNDLTEINAALGDAQ